MTHDRAALSFAAFEDYQASNAFTYKLDAHRAGDYDFTPEELLGRAIFRGTGNCSACHIGIGRPGAAPLLFTEFTYDNLGVPRNPDNPFLVSNPNWRDPGLSGFLETLSDYAQHAESNLGRQKVPTLRIVALGSCEAAAVKSGDGNCIIKAYMHNGYFMILKSMVHFCNTRD